MGLSAWQDDLPCIEMGELHRKDGEGAWSGCVQGGGFWAPRKTLLGSQEHTLGGEGRRGAVPRYRAGSLGLPQRMAVDRGASCPG